jgi:endonuclease YncB( thermonuclease family)
VTGPRVGAGPRKTLFAILLVRLILSQTGSGREHEVTRVYDGDTINVKGDSRELTIRLVGIDAPVAFGIGSDQDNDLESGENLKKSAPK